LDSVIARRTNKNGTMYACFKNVTLTFNYSNQIARQLHTQYVEGI